MEYISLDESSYECDLDREEVEFVVYKVKYFSWERFKLIDVKIILDEIYLRFLLGRVWCSFVLRILYFEDLEREVL